MNDEFLIDSNILVYAFDSAEKEKHDKASYFLKNAVKQEEGFLSVQTLSEFHSAVTAKIEKKISREKSLETLRELKDNFRIIRYDESTIIEAINLEIIYKIPFWDALIAATMQENNLKTICTENEKDFKKVPWIKTINPLKEQRKIQ